MNHYCTYFDRGFLIQGLALWRSLAAQDLDAVLWVLALDDFTADVLREIGGTWMRVVTLAEVEAGDTELLAAKANRSRVEYFFTLSPCWPRWLLAHQPAIDRLTYVDADLFYFADPTEIYASMDSCGASVMATAHRFPEWLDHYEQHGHFNVGILSWRRDPPGLECLDDWRRCCLEWCHDFVADDRYADQKYLDRWPALLGDRLLVLEHPGVNLAPWNWTAHDIQVSYSEPRGVGPSPRADVRRVARPITVDGRPLVAFHFARFRPVRGTWWWQSGQLDYGVMPWTLRQALYARYWTALDASRCEIRRIRSEFDFAPGRVRLDRDFWRALPLRIAFGSDWLRIGNTFVSARFGVGRWSGRAIAILRSLRSL